ncbi:hypothetical protein [Agrococcus sp. SGAir0287]|uniref:hypothetical protein n=1 Tax=Agrococcus sp. SGAir0287 TaxID=2070347 RepID=UPI001586D8BF|nr:hypothetical protein [Agrococcus sp. SGAir0287]
MTTRAQRADRAERIEAARADLAEQGISTPTEDAYLAGIARGLTLADEPDGDTR